MTVSAGVRHTVEITTVGARTGQSRRIEIWCHEVENRWYLAGFSRRRDWYANLLAEPRMIVHTDAGDQVVEASPVVDGAHRYAVFAAISPGLVGPEPRSRAVVVTQLMRHGVLVEIRSV